MRRALPITSPSRCSGPRWVFSPRDALSIDGAAQRAGLARGLVFVLGLVVACLIVVYGPDLLQAETLRSVTRPTGPVLSPAVPVDGRRP